MHGTEVATPPLTDDVLAGITRSAIMRIAGDAGLEVVERPIDRSELYLADEVFLSGTGVQVAPVSSIDGRPVGTGEFPTSLDIQRRYFAAVRGSDPRIGIGSPRSRTRWHARSAGRETCGGMTLSNLGTNPDTPAGVSIERWTATSGSERGSQASLVLHGGDHRWRAHAEGNGAIDAS